MKNLRLKLMLFLYGKTQHCYRKFFRKKKRQWTFTEAQLLYFQEDSLGRRLGEFYKQHKFRMIPKMEHQDVYHLLTETGTKIQDEIAMQYLLFGNGKRSAYLLGILFLGTFIYPEFLKTYLKAYRKGMNMKTFHHWNFEELLAENINYLKDFINQKEIIVHF